MARAAARISTYSYDPLNQLISEDHGAAGLRTWSYDAARRRATEAAPDGPTVWSYDPADQLLTAAGPDGITAFSYDDNGSRLLMQPPTGAPTSYAWNAQQRLSGIALPTGTVLTQAYRSDNLRHLRTGDNGPEVVVWDGDDPRLWSGAGAGPVQFFVPGPAFVNRAVGVDGSGNPVSRQYHEDALGSVQATTNESGTVETNYVLDAWGNVLSGSATDNPLDYVGGQSYWAENGAGLKYVRERWLDAQTAGWLSVDPESGEPRYSYVGNLPTRMTDPSGRRGEDTFDEVLERVIGAVRKGEEAVIFLSLRDLIRKLKGTGPRSLRAQMWQRMIFVFTTSPQSGLPAPGPSLGELWGVFSQIKTNLNRVYSFWRRSLPQPARRNLPSTLVSLDGLEWMVGFVAGFAEAIDPQPLIIQAFGRTLNPGGEAAFPGLLDLVVSIYEHGVSMDALLRLVLKKYLRTVESLNLVQAFIDVATTVFGSAPPDVYTGGKRVGLFNGTLLMLLLALLTAGELAAAIISVQPL